MSTTSTTLQERLAETRAAAAGEQVVRILNETIADPSTKRFAKSRPARIERWLQLERIASEQANGLQALAKSTVKRVVRPKVAGTGIPVSPIETATAQQTA